MKLKDIEPGKFYAIGTDSDFCSMEKRMVIAIGRWQESWGRTRQLTPTSKGTRKVGVARMNSWDKVWRPEVIPAQRVWGLWEDWEKEQESRKKAREREEEARWEASQRKKTENEEIHRRLLALGFEENKYRWRGPQAQGFDLDSGLFDAHVSREQLVKLIEMAEGEK